MVPPLTTPGLNHAAIIITDLIGNRIFSRDSSMRREREKTKHSKVSIGAPLATVLIIYSHWNMRHFALSRTYLIFEPELHIRPPRNFRKPCLKTLRLPVGA